MTTIESAEGLLLCVGVLELEPTALRHADPAEVAEQTAIALYDYTQGRIETFGAAFEKPAVDPQASEFSKKAHVLFRQHVGLETLSLGTMWTHQKLIGSTSLYGCAEFNAYGSIRIASYRGHNWHDSVPAQFLNQA